MTLVQFVTGFCQVISLFSLLHYSLVTEHIVHRRNIVVSIKVELVDPRTLTAPCQMPDSVDDEQYAKFANSVRQ